MKIAMLISGGVDSSVALALLKQQGHQVTAFYIKIWLEDELSFLGDNCPWREDLSFIEAVCSQFDVPLKVVSLQKEYHERVVSSVVDQVKQGRTPNPDMLCNQQIKFGLFVDHIDDSYDKIATGHYAWIEHNNGQAHLFCSPDEIKDQTYFLGYLNKKQLNRAFFPIGNMKKEQVRALAREFNLPNKDRKDSQGICFLGKLKFNDFLKHYLGERPGPIIEFETGKKLGTHQGFWFHTIGQRQGLGLSGGPWYVVNKDPKANRVSVSSAYYTEDKKRNSFLVESVNWFDGVAPEKNDLRVKLRHGPKIYGCQIIPQENGQYSVSLQEDDQGIAPGQFAVFYDENRCLGAGIITESRI